MPIWQPTQAIARPAYYDRQPSLVLMSGALQVAPHAKTLRSSYTPPLGYAAFIESVWFLVERAGTGASGFEPSLELDVVPDFGGTFRLLDTVVYGNVANVAVKDIITSMGWIGFGNTLKVSTEDVGVGGLVTYIWGTKGTEFVY